MNRLEHERPIQVELKGLLVSSIAQSGAQASSHESGRSRMIGVAAGPPLAGGSAFLR